MLLTPSDGAWYAVDDDDGLAPLVPLLLPAPGAGGAPYPLPGRGWLSPLVDCVLIASQCQFTRGVRWWARKCRGPDVWEDETTRRMSGLLLGTWPDKF